MTTPTIFHYGHKLTSKSQNQIGRILERLRDGAFGKMFPLKSSELSPAVKKWGLDLGILKQSSSRKIIIDPIALSDGCRDITAILPKQILWNEVVQPMFRNGSKASSGIHYHPDWGKVGLEPDVDITRIKSALFELHKEGYIDITYLGNGFYEYREID
jgi:hypothetical protein